MDPQLTATIATGVISATTSVLPGLIKKFTKVEISEKDRVEIEKELRSYSSQIEAEVQIFLMSERIKYDVFKRLLDKREEIYKDVWIKVDPVSQGHWNQAEGGGGWTIDYKTVSALYNSLAEINRDKGFYFDPTSRWFLWELREACGRCTKKYKKESSKVHWVYEDKESDYPHGIRLWMTKTALRRSMVREINSPSLGDPRYFNENQQMEIEREVREQVRKDYNRGQFPASEKAASIIADWGKSAADAQSPVPSRS